VAPDLGLGASPLRYVYDLDGRLTQIIRPDGSSIQRTYDGAGRLSSIELTRGTITRAYDLVTGQLRSITGPDGVSVEATYDGALLTGRTWSGVITGSVSDGFDAQFQVLSRSVNGADPITFTRDDDGLLVQAGAMTLDRGAQDGRVTNTTLGSVVTASTYDEFGRVATFSASIEGTELLGLEYTYDVAGRISRKTENVSGAAHTYDYDYDRAGRLVEVKLDGSTAATYTYDANGNRLSREPVSGTYDVQDRLESYGSLVFAHSLGGELSRKTNTMSGEVTNYEYDALGNLLAVALPDGRRVEYLTDGTRRRVGKKVDGTPVQGFLYKDRLNPVAELDGAGSVVSRFVYGAQSHVPAYMIRRGSTYRILTDHLGSPRFVVDAALGTIVQRMDYDEFGRVTLDTNAGFQPFGFGGGLYDPDTGLTRFGARDYDAQIGRWTAKDPALFGGGDTNLYAYVANDPVNRRDERGLEGGEQYERPSQQEIPGVFEHIEDPPYDPKAASEACASYDPLDLAPAGLGPDEMDQLICAQLTGVDDYEFGKDVSMEELQKAADTLAEEQAKKNDELERSFKEFFGMTIAEACGEAPKAPPVNIF
jgi:RHS repeat-associated protein